MNFMVNTSEMSKTQGATPQHPVDKRTEMLKNFGIPEDVINKGDVAVKEYANKHNINLPNPPKKNVPVGQGNAKPSTQARDKELIRLGIPADVIAQGDKAIEKYAQEHNINLPEKRDK